MRLVDDDSPSPPDRTGPAVDCQPRLHVGECDDGSLRGTNPPPRVHLLPYGAYTYVQIRRPLVRPCKPGPRRMGTRYRPSGMEAQFNPTLCLSGMPWLLTTRV
ncbi:uncharacterized protein CCOS01_04451 [Colletotrichum costaricense]|uniref:Uncharacterized protein n=1 Tax=Colletotrichum costaricense TaxID=1209916 RepID=A0AAI9Z413_9PEZI|nr:uncharacterized protein CCOS01_04451 [Colletotrichum costaricense]KAK1532468.1 hypothetical protein CCOS01_04451 [Colletotrichum costaricense]